VSRPLSPTSGLPKETAKRTELRKRSFDQRARLYDRARPSYPEELFDDLVRLSGLAPDARILEIGPGTGQATLPLARRGFAILGLELGKHMADLARRNLRQYPKVEIRNVAFEDWTPEPETFDLVLAATAFHWIPGRIAWPRCAKILRPGGQLALLWNFPDNPAHGIHEELRAVYQRLWPEHKPYAPPAARIERQSRKVVSSGRFGPVLVRRYPWQRESTTQEYIDQLRTQSNHAILAPECRAKLFRAIRGVIDRHGGRITRPVVAVLFLAPKRQDSGSAG
jgi:SAM-dependent methyltransferase